MSIFELHSAVLNDYQDFVRSFFTIADDRARQFVDRALIDEARLWPDFLLQVSPSYERVATVDDLATRGEILEETARIFRTNRGEPFHLYRHQVEAIEKGSQRRKLRCHERHRFGKEPRLLPADCGRITPRASD